MTDVLVERVSKQVEEAARRHGMTFTAGQDPVVPTLHKLLAMIPGPGEPEVGGMACVRCGNYIRDIGRVGPANFTDGEPAFVICLPCATLESIADAAVQVEARTGELGELLATVHRQLGAAPSVTEPELQTWLQAVHNAFIEYLRRITGIMEDAHISSHVAEATQVWNMWKRAEQAGDTLRAAQYEARFMAILFG